MYSVKIPDNWTPAFDLTNAEEAAGINCKGDEEIEGITGDNVKDKLGQTMELGYLVFYKFLRKSTHLCVKNPCIVRCIDHYAGLQCAI